ncbi:sigma-70 family RNA polymerase sigma factor [candidate division KSB1 bacterium]|nr:sigma-70 family RNA polymerase sigma factor [candidate division KSB1 bacterium]
MTQEQQWIQQAQTGDTEAFRHLVECYQKLVFKFCYDLTGNIHDSEDLSQEVFIKMWRNLKSFRSEAKMSSWLYRITMNAWIDRSRKKNIRVHADKAELKDETLQKAAISSGSDWNPETQTESIMLNQEVQTALNALTPRERAVFTLRHYEDLKLQTIGEQLGLTTGSVKSLLFRAVRKLQDALSPVLKEQLS